MDCLLFISLVILCCLPSGGPLPLNKGHPLFSQWMNKDGSGIWGNQQSLEQWTEGILAANQFLKNIQRDFENWFNITRLPEEDRSFSNNNYNALFENVFPVVSSDKRNDAVYIPFGSSYKKNMAPYIPVDSSSERNVSDYLPNDSSLDRDESHRFETASKSTGIYPLRTDPPSEERTSSFPSTTTEEDPLVFSDDLDMILLDLGESVGIKKATIDSDNYLTLMQIEGLKTFLETTQCVEKTFCRLGINKDFFSSWQGRFFNFFVNLLPKEISGLIFNHARNLVQQQSTTQEALTCQDFHCLSSDDLISDHLFPFGRTFLKHLLDSGCLEKIACENGLQCLLPETLGRAAGYLVSHQIVTNGTRVPLQRLAANLKMTCGSVKDCEEIACGFQ